MIDKEKKQHWSDRHWKLITVVTIIVFVGSIVFLWVMGPSIR